MFESCNEAEVEFANLDAYGVAGADERAAEAATAYAAGFLYPPDPDIDTG